MDEVLITIFTATYNRAHTLHRVYESLAAQTFRDFEWLVIDDGSTDNTAEVVTCWQKAADFPIRYYQQANRGKHIAQNVAGQLAQGYFLLSADSDDRFLPNAFALLVERWKEIPTDRRCHYTGVACLCIDQYGNRVGPDMDSTPCDMSLLNMVYVEGRKYELCRLVRTEIVREFPFPDRPGMIYTSESLVWDRVARKYLTRFTNDRVRVYYLNEGEDNTSGTGRMTLRRISRMAPGLGYWHQQILLTQMDYFRHSPYRFFISALHFVRFSWLCGQGVRRQWNDLAAPSARLLWLAAFIAGTLVFLRDRFLFPKE